MDIAVKRDRDRLGAFFDFAVVALMTMVTSSGWSQNVPPSLSPNVNNGCPAGLDLSFNPGAGANDDVFVLATQSDGKVLIGGQFTSYDGVAASRIARLNSDGSFDPTFRTDGWDAGVDGDVYALAIQPDGKIVVGGAFIRAGGGGKPVRRSISSKRSS